MLYKRFLLFFFLSLCCFKAFPAVFVVTSNADSGPGTLRWALYNALTNDSTLTDYIKFNLPDLSIAGRTITLHSQLPDVSSNLIIDASTQPGAKFGVSDAHVALFYSTPVEQTLSGLAITNKHDVQIYGLYIKNLTDFSKATIAYFWKGIDLRNDKNIQIGASGKGNVINGFYYSLIVNFTLNEPVYFENLTLKDNIFDVDADGKTMAVNQIAAVSIFSIIGQIFIGGNASEGNLFAQGLFIDQDNNVDSTDTNDRYISSPAKFIISNNKIGVDFQVQNVIPTSSGLNIGTVDPGGKNECVIEDNVIVGQTAYAIFIINNGLPVTILRNYIGTDKTKTKSFKTNGIFIYGASSLAIGSSNPTDANYITNCNPVTIWPYSNVTVNKNSFYCTIGAQPMHLQAWNEFTFPVINIFKITGSSVSGTATANSTIELFYSDKCGTCSPQTYFASVIADANGNWKYNGPVTSAVIASATLGLNTSDFSQTTLNTDSVKIINTCGNGYGSITGIVPYSAANVKWIDSKGVIVGINPDLLNVKTGKYKLLVQNGSCTDSTSYYEIKNRFQLDTTGIVKTEPSCGNSSGSISGLNIINNDSGQPYIKWQDGNGKALGYSLTLNKIPAGSYYLHIKSADSTCSQTFGPFTLKNVSGPNIDQSKVAIQPTNCGQSTGSITNLMITGTGTLKYSWLNDQQQQVATSADLTNQPAGTYKLQVIDDTQCGPIFSSDFEIPELNGIILDESNVQTTIASCSKNNGSVTGIIIDGATQYQWLDANNKVVATTPDLQNAAAGDYTLTASNNYGCTETSKPYHIGQQLPTNFPVYTDVIVSSCFGEQSGSISVATDALVKSARWQNSLGQIIGTTADLTGVATGVYQLYLTDQNGCESLYESLTVPQLDRFTVAQAGEVTNDQCGLKTGSVTATTVSGGLPPYTYKWVDAGGVQVGSESAITNLPKGSYTLNIIDSKCGNIDIDFTINEQTEDITAPSVNNVQLCSSGTAVLTVNNPEISSTYRLYNSQTSTQPLDVQTGGTFNITVSSSRSYFISQFTGTCESSRSEVKVTVGISSLNIINAFTPNGDGINDYWKITGIENYPDATVRVFNRYGQKEFDSKGYAIPFDGRYGGKILPPGVYYYIINLSNNCNMLSGSLTIIR